MMRYRTLGKTGIAVSEIGFGTWGLGGTAYGTVDDAVSVAALLKAVDMGVTFFDTADLYGDGHCEKVLAETLKERRGEIIIATKGGTKPHSTFVMPQDFSHTYIRQAFENSLQRLQTDYVDLYLLHSPPLDEVRNNGGLFALLENLKQEGKIRAFGISARTPADALCVINEFDVDVLEVNFNIIDHRVVSNELLDKASSKGVGIIARTPLAFGYLTRKLTGDEELPSGVDHRANWPKTQLRRWAAAPNYFDFLFTEETGRTPAQAALRFCLDFEEIATVIPGMLDVAQVLENVAASSVPSFSAVEMQRVFEIYRTHESEFYDTTFKKVKE
jgi:aryl-alcohol dehydrogenase-like predicted oxidoreductase